MINAILESIKTRRSVRKYKPDMVEPEKINQIIEAGLYAASGMNHQETKIIAVTNKELRDKLSAEKAQFDGLYDGADPFYGAPVVLVVIANKDYADYVYDGSLVMGNLMLAAHAVGVGSCWICRTKETFAKPEYQDFLKSLGITGNWEGIGYCILGYANSDTQPEIPRKPNRVYHID